jgi:hypothetical protein
MLITGAAAGAGAASSPPVILVTPQVPKPITAVVATPIIVFLRPDQVPSFDCSNSSDIYFVFIFY